MALLKRILFLLLISSLISSVQGITDKGYNSAVWASSDYDAGHTASKAIDRNNASYWAPLAFNGSIGIDLGKNYSIQYISIYSTAGFTLPLYVNGSYDNTTWTQIYYNSSFVLSGTKNIDINSDYRYLNISSLTSGSLLINEIYVYVDEPQLITPQDDESLSKDYPPLTDSILFEWSYDLSGWSSNLIVAKDINFNIIAVDTTTSNNYSTQALEAGNYWWKVRYYNATSGTYYNYSNVSNFTLTNTIAATGTGIAGTVYELIGTTQTPISGATVYLYNNTLSQSTITGSNGYYLFDGLDNSTTYNIYVSKQGYDTTAILPTTTGLGTITTKDILMKIYISPYVPNFIFQKIIVRSIFDKPYPGVTINIFKNNDVVASFTGTTDSMGQIVFQLIKDQYYRVELSGGGLPNTLTNYFYAKEEAYLVSIAAGYPTTGDMMDEIIFSLSTSQFNSTYYNLSVSYNDTRSSTTIINFYARNLTNNATCTQTSTSQVVTLNCTVLAAGSYRFGFNSTSTIYGLIQKDKIIDFDAGNANVPRIIGDKIDADVLNWVSILLIIFIGGFFSIISVKIGAILVPLSSLFLWWMGALNVSIIFITMACIIGVMVYMRKSEVKVNY